MKQQIKNQFAAMKDQLLAPSKYKATGRVIKDSGGGRLPSVSTFDVTVNSYNKIFEQIGIKLRLPPKVEIKINSTKSMNRYMAHQLLRIRRYMNTNPELSGKIAVTCVQHSKAFRASAINHVMSGGYFKVAESELFRISRRVDKLVHAGSADLDYKRVYIPKSNDRGRPLGVPTVEGRIYLHMGNAMILEFYRDYLLPSQHAYIPGRGVNTAGKEIVEKVRKAKYIYETDLMSFFDNISVFKIIRILNSVEIPIDVSAGLTQLLKSTPKLPKEQKLDESKFKFAVKYDKSQGLNGPDYTDAELRKHRMNYLTGGMNSGLASNLKFRNLGIFPGGVPQGMPLSPFLAILGIKDYLSQVNSVNYADDQVFYSDTEFEIQDDERNGIIHAKEKCGGVKYNNVGSENGLKFLGYRLKDNKLSSETRSGTAETIKTEVVEIMRKGRIERLEVEMLDSDFNSALSKFGNYGEDYLDNIVSKNIFGFILACLNTGDGENDHSLEDRRKAIRSMLKQLHKKSGLKRVPDNLQSSSAVYFLMSILNSTMKRGVKTKVTFKK